jgi:hypothetical protein
MEREATVILRYRDMLRRAVLDAITDGVSYTYFDVQAKEKVFRKITPDRIKWEIDGDGYPIITDPQAYLAILNAHLQKIHFAERTARANALRIVFLELLGRDEEDGEKESEGETTEGKSETEEGQEEDPQKLLEDAIRQVIAKARTATGGDRDASSTLFRTTAEGVGLKIATPKEIKSVEEAQRILNALPLSVFEKDSSTRSESGDSVLDDPEKSKSDEIGELAKDPELEQRRNMVALECLQILEGRNTARFKTVEEVIAKMCELAEINNPTGDLQQIVSVEQGEMILQAILDYLVE